MKEHLCPVEKALINYEGECNWCGEREWVGLTDEEIEGAIDDGFAFGLNDGNVSNEYVIRYARAIEAKLKQLNT